MLLSPEARAARKKAQLARLDKKGDDDYPIIYAQQPEQRRQAAENAAIRQALHQAKLLISIQAQTDAEGAVAVFQTGGNLSTVEGDS